MSKITLTPNANGAGTFTIASPNSGTNRTLTLPDSDGTLLTSVAQSDIAAEAVNESKLQVSNAPTNGYMLTAQSGDTGGLTWAAAPTSSTTAGAVGTYGMMRSKDSDDAFGSTVAGSTVIPCSAGANASGSSYQTGTWRTMGRSTLTSAPDGVTIFVRIA